MACTWKNRVLLAAFWDKISIFHLGQTEHSSAHGDGPLCSPLRALIDVELPVERKKPSWINWTIEISPCTRWFLLSLFPARRSHFQVSHLATYCARWSFTSYRPVVNMCSHFGARVRRRHMPRETARALPQVPQHFDGARANGWLIMVLNKINRWLILLASHRMALTRERENSSQIAREIEIFSIFAWLVPTLVPKHNSRFWVFCRTICWTWWSINIFETFGRKKIAVILRNLVCAPCSETGPNLRTSLLVDPWL